MYVVTFKTDIAFISNVIICLITHSPIIFSIKVILLILTISLCQIKEKMSNLSIKKHIFKPKAVYIVHFFTSQSFGRLIFKYKCM